jgi:hypothetical protein
MKPCDVKSLIDHDKLEESGLCFNQNTIEVDSMGVFLTIEPHCRMKFRHNLFKRFAEWYLEDQAK